MLVLAYIFLGQMSPLIGDARKMKKWWCFIVDRILNSFTPISYQATIFVINMVLILIFREYNFSEVYFDWFFSKSVFWHWSFTMFLSNSPIFQPWMIFAQNEHIQRILSNVSHRGQKLAEHGLFQLLDPKWPLTCHNIDLLGINRKKAIV